MIRTIDACIGSYIFILASLTGLTYCAIDPGIASVADTVSGLVTAGVRIGVHVTINAVSCSSEIFVLTACTNSALLSILTGSISCVTRAICDMVTSRR